MKNKHPMLSENHPFKLGIASVFGVGFLPASGTWGSFVGMLLAPLLKLVPFLTTTMVILSFCLGIWCIPALIKDQKDKDPGFVVIDELMGQLIVFAFLPYDFANPVTYLLGFVLFRLFDILKPWPVSFYDRKVHNAWGIMLDDFMAGVYAATVLALIQMLSIY